MTIIYTTLDLLSDLQEIIDKSSNPMVIYTLDELVLKIYYKNHKRVALETIKKKLQQLARKKIITIKQKRTCKYGVCTSEKARVYIRRSVIMTLLPTSKTITLMNYINKQ